MVYLCLGYRGRPISYLAAFYIDVQFKIRDTTPSNWWGKQVDLWNSKPTDEAMLQKRGGCHERDRPLDACRLEGTLAS